ncbi:chitobiosyldiphosphodolichol beta-mannosyltransferase [Lethenteron reissneri]|uniref:chitobiosyldiphosphodolichol beta-mannosyltransferase n=1 Tax=Lethenteron reissneri TaxID=7753 RepID=UPI002AB7920C|nr:chitobiosyldiphosphodolichol beta-mannosyltransferase [Lethenteron reissneri]
MDGGVILLLLAAALAAVLLLMVAVLVAVVRSGSRVAVGPGSPPLVCVLVLGDVGRSPRMTYHALSLAEHGFQVRLLGYRGAKPAQHLLENERISIVYLRERMGCPVGPRLLRYVSKVLLQALQLACTLLLHEPRPQWLLLQNPPGLPAMAVSWFCCRVRGARLAVDWHNYGYTIMGLSLGGEHPLVRVARWYEGRAGRLADAHLCVTSAMRHDLEKTWGVQAVALHDRPAEAFRETALHEQHELLTRLGLQHAAFAPPSSSSSQMRSEPGVELTALTERSVDGTRRLPDGPALLVSSTSWTEDEDFSILLKALEDYDRRKSEGTPLPALLCVITGRGPLKSRYEAEMASLHLRHVSFCTPWLQAEDYPRLLGAADLGVCLHKSSSGLDLPMKVVDMFGCCLPVCAVSFPCLHELVQHGENGLVFSDSRELAQQLEMLLAGPADQRHQLARFRARLRVWQQQRWRENWTRVVLPVLLAP